MASRFLLAAAVALYALLATAAASPPPVTSPCGSNMTSVAAAFTNVTNTELAKKYGQTSQTSKQKSVSFTVPKFCPLFYCYGGKPYTATAGEVKTTTGTTNMVSDWSMTQTSCSNTTGIWIVSGSLNMVLTWTSPITVTMVFNVKGFLGVTLDFTVAADVNGLAGNVPGTWTMTSTNGVTGTITAINFAGCTLSVASVDLEVGTTALTAAASEVEAKIMNSGPTLCSDLNKQLAPQLLGKSVAL